MGMERRHLREIENTWILLADGTRLGARIWLPEDVWRGDEPPVPAVLEYLPYRKDDGTAAADARRHPYFAERGYAAVRVDIRGTGDSDGLLRGEYLQQEQDDALEVLQWLEQQAWCSGRVGMIGYSWGGFNGLQVAALAPPQLGAVVSVASTDDRYLDDCHYMGGCLLGSDMLKWASTMLTYALQPPDPRFVGSRWREMWLHRLANAPELARDWVSHQLRGDFWKHGSVAEDYAAIQCPVMAVGGWADAYTNAVPRLLENLRVPRRGLIGPWGHMMPHEGVPGPATAFLDEVVRWWDQWLKGIDTGIMDEPLLRAWLQDYVPPARFHAVRPGRWMAVGSWPPQEVAPQVWALEAGGGLTRADAATPGAATAPGAAAGTSDRWLTIHGRQECGETAGVWCANGFPDEMAADQRPDDVLSLCFTSPALGEPLEVLGHPELRLRVAADHAWALIAARVEDVAPDGASLLVSWGLLNLTHREGHEHPKALEPGRPYDVVLQLRVCGHRFAAGHRVRLAVSPTYWPHAWPSPAPVTLSVAVDGDSVLELPRVDRAVPAAPPPAVSPTLDGAVRQVDTRIRRVVVDQADGRHEIRDRELHERTIAATGLRYREEWWDSYVIVEDEPLSAAVHCRRLTISEAEEGTGWRVEVEAEMTCGEAEFRVQEEYAALVDGEELFRGERSYVIPRDLV